MKELDENAKYSMTIRDANGKRTQLLFENRDALYEYCENIYNKTAADEEYEIIDFIKYQTLWDETFAIPLYSAINTCTEGILWEDILGYIA